MKKNIVLLFFLQILASSSFSQPVNDECENAIPIGPLVANESPSCIFGTTLNANPEDFLNGCNMMTEETVWYLVLTNFETTSLNVFLNSDEIANPTLQIFEGSSCGFFDAVDDCKSGIFGQLTMYDIQVNTNTGYYIAISQEEGIGGNFELCVGATSDNGTCELNDQLIVTNTSLGSPLDGPYQPGEEVTFDYTLTEWNANAIGQGNNCEWLHGIIPVFGNGWDEDSWDDSGKPITSNGPNSVYGAFWEWNNFISLNEENPFFGLTDVNGDGLQDLCSVIEPNCVFPPTPAQTILPGGWFAFNPGQNTDPNFSFGDGAGCDALQGVWNIQFTLKTKNSGTCNQGINTDCSVKIFTFSDGETGLSNNPGSICSSDIPLIKPAILNCCISLDLSRSQLCTNDIFSFQLSPIDSLVFDWRALPNPNVIGALPGAGNIINQNLINTSDTVQIIQYIISADSLNLCQLNDTLIVEIFPNLIVLGEQVNACDEDSLDIAFTNFNGTGAYSFGWSNNVTDSVNQVFISNDTIFGAVIFDENTGCIDTTFYEVYLQPDLEIDLDLTVQDRVINLFNNSIGTVATTWSFGDGVFSSGENPRHEYSADGTYQIIASIDNGCEIFDTTFNVLIQSNEVLGFNASLREACAPFNVQFFDSSSTEVFAWEWTFEGGNPEISNEQNPMVSYEDFGSYDVQLKVGINDQMITRNYENYIDVFEVPDASFSFIIDALEVEFINESFFADEYFWDFGDGNTSNEREPIHVYELGGVYTSQLVVTNRCGTDTIRQSIDATFLPVANFSVEIDTICVFESVNLLNNSTGRFNNYLWVIEGGSPDTSIIESPTITFNNVGNFNIKLMIENSFGEDSILIENAITVLEPTPADFDFIRTEDTLQFVNSPVGNGSILWNFGDGTTSTMENPRHVFDSTGIYIITLLIDDGFCQDSIQKEINFISTAIDLNFNDTTCKIFPNPSDGAIYLDLGKEIRNEINVNIYNQLGALVNSEKLFIGPSTFKLNWESKHKGVYFISVSQFHKILGYHKVFIY